MSQARVIKATKVVDQLGARLGVGRGEIAVVAVGRDHHMAVGVRVAIQEDEHRVPAEDNQRRIPILLGGSHAKNAGPGLIRHQVIVAPRGEENFGATD